MRTEGNSPRELLEPDYEEKEDSKDPDGERYEVEVEQKKYTT